MTTTHRLAKRKRNELFTPSRVQPSPFLDDECEQLGLADDLTLQNIFSFVEHTKNAKIQRNLDGKLVSTKLCANVEKIISTYNAALIDSTFIGKQDASNLIFPWAIKCLLFLSTSEDSFESDLVILWKSLALSIDIFIANADTSASTYLHQGLSTQALNKLIPFAVKTAFSTVHSSVRMHSARAFVLLVDNFYRPTFDHCCSILLVDLEAQVGSVAVMNHDKYVLSNDVLNSIVVSALQLVRTLQDLGVSTPKKMFQNLAKESIMLAVSKLSLVEASGQDTTVHKLASEILWVAFFCPTNHIEGYLALQIDLVNDTLISREKWKETMFRCYQGDLLWSVSSLLRNALQESDTRAISHLVVSLVEGLFVQAMIWQRNSNNQVGSKDNGSLSTMLFRVWGVFANTVLMKLESSTEEGSANLMSTFVSCLKILLNYNGYHPTYVDKDQHHFLFLKSLSRRLQWLLRPSTSQCGLDGLTCMLQLNHLLFHDDLPETIALAAKNVGIGDKDFFHRFMCTLFTTYQQLRQLDFLVEALVASNVVLKRDRPDTRTTNAFIMIREALEDCDVARAIAFSVAAAPDGQAHSVFEVLNISIAEEVSSVKTDDARCIETVAMIASLFVLLLRNIKVGEHTSKDISLLCEKSLAESVSLLVTNGKACAPLVKHGIHLSGWILDLRNRCSFWTPSDGQLDSFNLPETLVSLLNGLGGDSTKPTVSISDQFDPGNIVAPWDLQFLACYRIQHLHSLILHHSLDDFVEESAASSRAVELLAEVRRLVGFVLVNTDSLDQIPMPRSSGTDNQGTAESPWVLLSQFLPAWTPYCDKIQVQVFLRWIFRVLSGVDSRLTNKDDANHAVWQTLPVDVEARRTVRAMLLDSTFFENQRIVADFVLSGLLHAAALITGRLSDEPLFPSLVNDDYSSSWDVPPLAIRSAFLLGTILRPKGGVHVCPLSSLQAALHIIVVLNNSPSGCRKGTRGGETLGRLLGLDAFIRFQMKDFAGDSDFLDTALQVLAGIRRLFSKTALENDRSVVKNFLSCDELSLRLIDVIISSSIELNNSCCQSSFTAVFRDFLVSSGEMVECVALTCGDVENMSSLSKLSKPFDIASTPLANEIYFYLICSVVKGLHASPIQGSDIFSAFAGTILDEARNAFADKRNETTSFFMSSFGNLVSIAGAGSRLDDRIFIEQHLLSIDIASNADQFNFLMGVVLDQDRDCVLPDALYNLILSNKSFEFIDDTVLARLIMHISISLFADFFDLCLTYRVLSRGEKRSRIFLLLLATVGQSDRSAVLALVGTKILSQAIDDLSIGQQRTASEAGAAADLLIELTKHRELVSLKERDIGRILPQVSCSLRIVDSTNIQDADKRLFYQFCALVASLVQRFPKQLYTCVASLTLALQKLFHSVLNTAENDTHVIDQCRSFSRLCEMIGPHKEILKKHIIGLIQDFIDALKNEMSPIRKKVLTPTIYSLLEMLSQYEVSQLNALLDSTRRALFQSFYEGYQKWHVYKGRF